MFTKFVIAVLVICAVIVKSEDYGQGHRMPEYLRIKGAKYYSNPPMRFYRKPPIPQPVKGIFSYTPPPNVMQDDSPHPGGFRPNKVSKRPPPSNEGLGDNDINNLIKYLTKKDLDKIISFAGEKYRGSHFEKYSNPLDVNVRETDEWKLQGLETNTRFSVTGPYVGGNADLKDEYKFVGPYSPSYSESMAQNQQNSPVRVFYFNQPLKPNQEESMKNDPFAFMDSHIQQDLNNIPSHQVVGNDFKEDKLIQEEQLPKPVNLREDDYEVANTDNVPRVVKSASYKVENFGDLPLMDYNSKLHTVSSYHVPHYSVISQPSSSSSSSQLVSSLSSYGVQAPKIEPAPHPSAAKDQSDAHLKAIKIWTHKSKGTAYTLHDDGTLSLERRGRPKPIYGHPY